MSEIKTIAILAMLGGRATTEEARAKARELYPDTQLARIIHNPLKMLASRGYVKAEIPGRYKSIKNTIWTINQYKLKKDAALEEYKEKGDYKKAKLAKKLLKDILILPEKPEGEPVILKVSEKEVREKMDQFEINPSFHTAAQLLAAEQQRQQQQQQQVDEPTPGQAIREAIKEPYLDKLKDLAENIDIKTHYRGRHDIIFDILGFLRTKQREKQVQHIQGPSTGTEEEETIAVNPTAIMYGCRLSIAQLQKYMAVAMKNGLVEKQFTSTRYVYKLTQKGFDYAELMDRIKIDFD